MSGRVMNYIKLKSGKSWCLQHIGNDQRVVLGKETKAFPTALKYKKGFHLIHQVQCECSFACTGYGSQLSVPSVIVNYCPLPQHSFPQSSVQLDYMPVAPVLIILYRFDILFFLVYSAVKRIKLRCLQNNGCDWRASH